MATLYEFVIKDQSSKKISDNKMTNSVTGEAKGKQSVAKTKPLSGSNKGVDHNRYTRPVMPIVNRYIPQFEKTVRGGRAIIGMGDTFMKEGLKASLLSVGSMVLLELALVALDDWRRQQEVRAKEINTANYNKLLTGQEQVSTNLEVSKNFFGKITYKNQ